MKRRTKVTFLTKALPFHLSGSSLASPVLIIISIILMAISAFKPNSFDLARSKTSDIFAPALSLVSFPFYHISIFLHGITGFAQLQADNLRLTQENKRLREWYNIALLLDSENKSLRDLLNLKVDPNYNHISARIIADAGNTYMKSFLAAAGRDRGVKKGAAVLSGNGLVGRIIEVGKDTSRILLVTDINMRVPVVVEGAGQHAIMAGTNDRYPKLIHLPQDSEILDGARLITSGYGGAYPHGLPVGKVAVGDDGVMRVALFTDFNKLQIVRILQKSSDSSFRKEIKDYKDYK